MDAIATAKTLAKTMNPEQLNRTIARINRAQKIENAVVATVIAIATAILIVI